MSCMVKSSVVASGVMLGLLVAACSHEADRSRTMSSHAESAKSEQRSAMPAQHPSGKAGQFIEGERPVLGRVEAVTSGQIKVDIGEVQPRFIPLKPAKEKHFSSDIKPGDELVLVLNAENLLVDYHPLNHPGGHHRIIYGRIAQNLPIGQDKVVIRDDQGKEDSFLVRSQARSKLAAINVGAPAVFLLDETNKVSDATFASKHAAETASGLRSPIKGANRQVDGTIVEPLASQRIRIKTEQGERPYEVHQVIRDRVSKLAKGDEVILLVDNDDKVIDVAVPPQSR